MYFDEHRDNSGCNDISTEYRGYETWARGIGYWLRYFKTPDELLANFIVAKCIVYLQAYSRFCEAYNVYKNTNKTYDYAKAIHELETSVYNFYTLKCAVSERIDTRLFNSGDGSALETVNKLYNFFKHSFRANYQDIKLFEDGVSFKREDVSSFLPYFEYEGCMRELADLCENISDGTVFEE